MSITCAFMSSRPSSNTANSPHGPAPMINTSVLIGSLMCSRGDLIAAALIWVMLRECVAAASSYLSSPHILRNFKSTTLGLPLGRAHHQAVELRRHLDLAGQARVRLHVVAEVEHVLLHRRRLAHRLAPCCIDMHVAGGTGAGAAAFRLDAGNAVLDRRLHHGRTELALDRAGGAFMIDIGDFRHTIGGTMQDTRQRWRPIAADARARQMTTDGNRRNASVADGGDRSHRRPRRWRHRSMCQWSRTATA